MPSSIWFKNTASRFIRYAENEQAIFHIKYLVLQNRLELNKQSQSVLVWNIQTQSQAKN